MVKGILKSIDVKFFFVIQMLKRKILRDIIIDDLFNSLDDRTLDIFAFHNIPPHTINYLALAVHHIVIFKEMFTNLKIVILHPLLRRLQGLR